MAKEIPKKLLDKIELAGCAIVQDRKEQVIPNVQRLYLYVDYFVLVDGGSVDGLQEELKKIDKDNKINIFEHKWCDNFPKQRTYYLRHAGELKDPDKELWIVRFDSDELISESILKRLKKLIYYYSNQREPNTGLKYTMFGITAKDIELDKEGNFVRATISSFKKGLIYRWYSDLEYVGSNYGKLHEGYNRPMIKYDLPLTTKDGKEELVYEHVKSQGDIWERSQRNMFIAGGGDNLGPINKGWIEFRKLLNDIMEPPPKTYHDYITYLKKGNIHPRLKQHFIKYMMEGIKDRNFNKYPKSETEKYFEVNPHMNGSGNYGIDYPGSSESREMAKFYYDWLYPEEVLDLSEDMVMDSPLEQYTKDYYLKYKSKGTELKCQERQNLMT